MKLMKLSCEDDDWNEERKKMLNGTSVQNRQNKEINKMNDRFLENQTQL